tara:strand:+ start:56 stop:331 length:276 start_codon:yes stop_codon:yes gene_type:complete
MKVQTFGSRRKVWNGSAKKTNGGLTKKSLRKNKYGRIVSVKASKSAKKHNHLKKAGWGAKKGEFGAVKLTDLKKSKKSKSSKKKSKGRKKR